MRKQVATMAPASMSELLGRPLSRVEREYKITIRIAGRTDLYHLQQFLHGRQRDMPQQTIQVLDVVLKQSPSLNYVTLSRSFFSTTFGHKD
jgi:eukaryotic translation initiation factor 2C